MTTQATVNTIGLDTVYPDLLGRLNDLLVQVRTSGYYKEAYQSVPTGPLEQLSELEDLPILRKSDFVELQRQQAPFGGIMASASRPDYLFVSPGPIHEPGFLDAQYWRMHNAMKAAGFTADDIVHNTFSYHLTPGAWIFDSGARALGCSVIPAGNAPLEQQLNAIKQYGANAYAGTPDFLKKLIDAYADAGYGRFPVVRALVSGGALTDGLKSFYSKAGISVSQCYATAELGVIAYDVEGQSSMRIDDDLVVEVIDPDTGRAMPFGEVGEVVVTTLRTDYPLVRFGTGDLSAFATDTKAGDAPALVGWLGRSDQTVKVRGMFVRPEQVQLIKTRAEGVHRVRLVVDRANEQDSAVLLCSVADTAAPLDPDQRCQQIAQVVRDTCHLNIDVRIIDEGDMVDDGKLIVDLRGTP
jgi:phenylacetate-CoA ligase